MSTKVQHILVDSSMVNTVSYYNDLKKLIVNFKNGRLYVYKNVDEGTFEDVRLSNSTGRALHNKVFGIFAYEEL
tara:strand:+ start:67 stop:288 length:222 start_codon:yes stop_codon:yes gene_type:complete